MPLIETRGPVEGVCNICGSRERLTEDHTPPKGCLSVSAVEIRSIVERLSPHDKPTRARVSQNGVKYRTLCARCNNTLLGGSYDPSLIQFVNSVSAYLKSNVFLPSEMAIQCEPQKVMRSVIGHLCAIGVDRYNKGANTAPIRSYLHDSQCNLPTNISVHFWPYPYRQQILVRDAALVNLNIHKPLLFWLMKFFPVAFLVTFDAAEEYVFPHIEELSHFRLDPFDSKREVRIRLRPAVHNYWPEAPADDTMIMYGRDAIFAGFKPRRRRS